MDNNLEYMEVLQKEYNKSIKGMMRTDESRAITRLIEIVEEQLALIDYADKLFKAQNNAFGYLRTQKYEVARMLYSMTSEIIPPETRQINCSLTSVHNKLVNLQIDLFRYIDSLPPGEIILKIIYIENRTLGLI